MDSENTLGHAPTKRVITSWRMRTVSAGHSDAVTAVGVYRQASEHVGLERQATIPRLARGGAEFSEEAVGLCALRSMGLARNASVKRGA